MSSYSYELTWGIVWTRVTLQTLEPPQYVYWYHNDKIINYDTKRTRVSFDMGKVGTAREWLQLQVCCAGKNSRKTSSRLVIARVEKSDSGNYTCSTTNAEPSTISVYVSEGQLPLVSLGHVTPPRALIGQNVSSCHDVPSPGIGRKSSELRPKFKYEVHFNNPL